ncbi:MAG: fimbrillin family protein [Bacteroides sp.]|nr:fimbrillin family protein [Bacteroides sp.]
MKKYIYSAAALMTLSMLTLTSCQNEMEQLGNPAGKEVLLRVTASRGDAATRTTLENDGDGGLTCKWNEGDQLLVVNNGNGSKLGVLTIVKGFDTPNGTFEGNVNLEGKDAISLVYLGTAGKAETYTANSLEINLSAQNGSFETLTDQDVLTAEAKVDDQNFLPTGNTVETSVTMTRQLAFGHFTLDFDGDVTLAAGDVITISGEGLKSEGKVNFRNGGSIPTATNYSGSTTITVTKEEGGNDFYITMLPFGDVTPTFTVVKGSDTYTATLGKHNWKAGEYVRFNDNGTYKGVTVKMEKVAKVEGDGKIFGIKWAAVNDRSWIDWSNYADDAFYFSYIPGISLEEQGINVNYTGDNIEKGTSNPYVYHYQWGRNFGFAASTGTLSGVRLPNSSNKPNSWASKYSYYQIIQGPGSPAQSIEYVDYFIWTTGNDWCNSNMSSWPVNIDEDGGRMSVTPEGFRLPTKNDFQTLLPGVSGTKYTAKKTFTVDGETIRPVYAKSTDEGTTVVWTILNSTTNYMALYEFAGSYTVDQLTQAMFEDEVIDYIDFPAHGCTSGTQANTLQYWQEEGWYWAGTSSATGYADMLRFTISGNDLTIYVAGMPRKHALSVRCIYED